MMTTFVIEYYDQLCRRPLKNLKIYLSHIHNYLNSLSSYPSKSLKPYKWNDVSEIQIDMKTKFCIYRGSWVTCCTWFSQITLTQCTATTLVCNCWKVLGHHSKITVSHWQFSIHQGKYLLVETSYMYITGKDSFNMELLILSYPGAEDFEELISPLISDSVTGSRYKE